MIFQRTLLREFANTGAVVFVVLLMITVTTQTIRMLGLAAQGLIPTEGVLILLGLAALRYLPVLLSLTLYISVLATLTRSYRDSEMVVWFSSGRSLLAWLRPVLWFGGPMVVVIAVLSLGLSPWAVRKAEVFRHQMETRDDVSAISPGVFKEAKNADRVYFVEKLSDNLTMVANIFVHGTQNGRTGVMVASRGMAETRPNGDRFLVLLEGRRYEGTPGNADYRIVEFDRYAVRIEAGEAKAYIASSSSRDTLDLLRADDASARGELVWRLGLPASALVLSLLAVPLSFVNPRAGRSLNLLVAVFLYMIYSNLLSVMQSWVGQGRLAFAVGLVVVHLVMAALCATLLWHRLSVTPWLRRRRSPQAASA